MPDTTIVNSLLGSAKEANNRLVALQKSSTTVTAQASDITMKATELRNTLMGIQKDAETYNQEFLDRVQGGGTPGFMKLRGVSTLQDWVLFYFYLIYGILCLSMASLAIFVSKNPLFAGSVVISFGLLIGIMMTAVLIRFG
jgi:hypothetical protein